MFKKLITASLLSLITFCVISCFSVLYFLIETSETLFGPMTNIGFPYKYYFQFWLTGNHFINWGWDLKAFILDILITSIITFAIYFLFLKLKNK